MKKNKKKTLRQAYKGKEVAIALEAMIILIMIMLFVELIFTICGLYLSTGEINLTDVVFDFIFTALTFAGLIVSFNIFNKENIQNLFSKKVEGLLGHINFISCLSLVIYLIVYIGKLVDLNIFIDPLKFGIICVISIVSLVSELFITDHRD